MGYHINIDSGKCNRLLDGFIQFQGRKFQGVYRIIADPDYTGYPSAHVATSSRSSGDEPSDDDQNGPDCESRSSSGSSINLWNARFGNANKDSIRQFLHTDAVTGKNLNTSKSRKGDCSSCVIGKQTRQTARKNTTRSLEPGAVIQTDVCGPMSVSSFTGARYFVSFIDECTGYMNIVPIARKRDVLLQFKRFHAWFERRLE